MLRDLNPAYVRFGSKSRLRAVLGLCPLYPQKRTLASLPPPALGERRHGTNGPGHDVPGNVASPGPSLAWRRVGALTGCAWRRALKTANQLVREIGSAVRPPQGVPIVLTEEPGAIPNWVAAAGIMENALTDKFSEKVAELRRTDPLVDWGNVKKGDSARRVVKFSSETT